MAGPKEVFDKCRSFVKKQTGNTWCTDNDLGKSSWVRLSEDLEMCKCLPSRSGMMGLLGAGL